VIMARTTKPWAVIVTCEHGGNSVPKWLRERFAGAEEVLASHRGWDPGALGIAQRLAHELHAPLEASVTSRLVADLNRSETNPTLFSEYTRELPDPDRARIIAELYRPYRLRIELGMHDRVARGDRILHLSVHTFTPELNGERRAFPAGILFDPGRDPECGMARAWIDALRGRPGDPDVRENQPYLGTDDGFTTHLRARLDAGAYSGMEIEVRNDLVRERARQDEWGTRLARALVDSVPEVER